MAFDFSQTYSSSNFIQGVSNKLIQIQNKDATKVTYSIDYRITTTTLVDNRFLTIYQTDMPTISLQFSTNVEALTAHEIFRNILDQLKDNTYNQSNNMINGVLYDPDTFITHDFSQTYHSSNFIQGVSNKLIQIQNKDATKVIYSIDYNKVTTTLVGNRFLIIYQTNIPTISLQFSTNVEALTAHDIFRNVVDQLKDNTYNQSNNLIDGVLYDPDTFIYVIKFEDYSVQIQNINGLITHTIVAEQVVSVYVSKNLVKVKSESTDTLISLVFGNSEKAIIAARYLRNAIKEITDRSPNPNGSDGGFKSFVADFTSDVWLLEPDVDFALSGFSLEYFELVCPLGGTSCVTEDLVKRSCKGLVQYNGNTQTNVLKSVSISFNQIVNGRAILISK